MSREPIAIVGIGCRLPGAANSPDAFWRLLSEGVDAVTGVVDGRWNRKAFYGGRGARPGEMLTRWGGFANDVDGFDADFFGISSREAAQLDPQQRLALELAWEAFEDAGQVPARLSGTNTGVFVGVSTADYRILQARDVSSIDPYSDSNSMALMVANRISYAFDLRGPSLAIDTACAFSAEALHLACRSLWRGETSRALAGGVNAVLAPQVSFGGGLLLLKPLSLALADGDRVYATIRGAAVSHGETSAQGWMAPSEPAQTDLLRGAYEDAGVSPADLVYVEAHGTETATLESLLAKYHRDGGDCWLGSVKTNIGHMEAAAGVAGVIKVALMLYHRQIPPSLHFAQPNPAKLIEKLKLRVPTKLMAMPPRDRPRIAGVSALGIGGSGAHVVLQEPPSRPQPVAELLQTHRVHLFPLSAHNTDALRQLAGSYARLLTRDDPAPPLQDIAYAAGVRRTHHRERAAWAVETREELRQELDRFAADGEAEAPLSAGSDKIRTLAFVFPGMGPQWWGMGRELLADEPVFAASLHDFDDLWRRQAGWSLVDEMRAGHGSTRIGSDVGVSAAANVAVQIALSALWKSWGIEPIAITGHSVGELAAACVAGILSLEDVVRVTHGRNQAIALLEGQGKMAAVGLSASEILPFLAGHEGAVTIAAINSPKAVTLSGTGEAVDVVVHALEADGVFCRVLRGDTPYHSPQFRRLHRRIEPLFPEVTARPPVIPYVSTVTGELLSTQRLDKAYWVRNAEEPVRFQAAMQTLIAQGCRVFIEVGPHPVLSSAITDCLTDRQVAGMVLSSLRREANERKTMLSSLGRLYREGFTVNWEPVSGRGQHLSLPSYPWQRKRYWDEPAYTSQQASSRLAEEPLHVTLRGVDQKQGEALLLPALQRQVAKLVGVSSPVCAPDRSLIALGVDSLASAELKNWIEREVRVTASTMTIMRGPTLQELAASIFERIVAEGPPQSQAGGLDAHTAAEAARTWRPVQMDRLLGPEEFKFWLFNRRLPFNVVATARIRGEVDANALERVLPRVRDRHLLLQVRITEDVRPRFVTDESRQVPLQVVARQDDRHWVRACEAELCRPFSTAMAPLLRVMLLKGEGISELIVSLPHVVADGLAAIFLLRDVIAALAGGALDLLPELPAFEELIPPSAFGPDSRNVMGRWWTRRTTEQFRALSLKALIENLPRVGPARIHSGRLSAEETARLAARCQAKGLTVHSAIAAAGLLALAHEEPTSTTCLHPVNLRDQLSPPLGDDLCLALSHVSTRHTVGRRSDYWGLAYEFRHRLMAALERGEAFDNTLGSIRKLDAKVSIVTELAPEISVTNVGRIPVDPYYGALQVEEIRFFGSNTMDAPSLAAVILQGRLSWNFFYPATWPRSAEANQITEKIRQLLSSALA
jgi:acyl transferase domain-containing protein